MGKVIIHYHDAVASSKVLDATTGPKGIAVTNLYASAGGERLQIRITTKEQAEWARENLGLRASGEGMGSYTLNEEQSSKLKRAMGVKDAAPCGCKKTGDAGSELETFVDKVKEINQLLTRASSMAESLANLKDAGLKSQGRQLEQKIDAARDYAFQIR